MDPNPGFSIFFWSATGITRDKGRMNENTISLLICVWMNADRYTVRKWRLEIKKKARHSITSTMYCNAMPMSQQRKGSKKRVNGFNAMYKQYVC